eukprot:3559102-Pleurochrysis_carterae.AAC.1
MLGAVETETTGARGAREHEKRDGTRGNSVRKDQLRQDFAAESGRCSPALPKLPNLGLMSSALGLQSAGKLKPRAPGEDSDAPQPQPHAREGDAAPLAAQGVVCASLLHGPGDGWKDCARGDGCDVAACDAETRSSRSLQFASALRPQQLQCPPPSQAPDPPQPAHVPLAPPLAPPRPAAPRRSASASLTKPAGGPGRGGPGRGDGPGQPVGGGMRGDASRSAARGDVCGSCAAPKEVDCARAKRGESLQEPNAPP